MNAPIRYWLVTTAHLEDRLLFPEESDFVTGMNYVALQAHITPVSILAFILMSNHTHFVLISSKEDAVTFINGFKARMSKYLRQKYNRHETLRENDVDFKELKDGNESLERAIAYVQMNCVAANICAHPSQYPWGTGNSFFPAGPASAGTPVADLSKRACIRILHSKIAPPFNWKIGDSGYILPSSYVRRTYVESIFRSAMRMNYFLNSSSKAKHRVEVGGDNLPSFKDQNIVAAIPDLCRTLFKKNSYNELSQEQKTEILRQIRYRFSADINQLARVTGETYDSASKLLDCI